MVKARTVVSIALIMYCFGIVVFAWTPTEDITWAEWLAGALGGIAIIGLMAHVTDAIYLPGEDYAYLVAGWAGFTVMLLYLFDTEDSTGRRSALSLFLLTGVVGAYGAYLAEMQVMRSRDG